MSDTAIIVIGIALGGLLAGSAHAANLVTNGGFETENLDGSGNPISPPPGWTITGDAISIDPDVFLHREHTISWIWRSSPSDPKVRASCLS